jgi:oxygen-independent coproporphyrinogen-3 oxidase
VAGLYVHVPFRRSEPPPDDAYTIGADATDVSRYKAALRRELTYYTQAYAADEQPTTIYVGGGRPSVLPLSSLRALLPPLADTVDLSAIGEATMDVHPADATPRYLHGLKHLGFTRLSLPVYSFAPSTLQGLDTAHTVSEAKQAIGAARKAGFELSIDLRFVGSAQPLGTWASTLHRAVEMNVPHITIEESTIEESRPDDHDDDRADKFELAMRLLRSEGYEQYELTHFARPGHRSSHQENYYDHGNYLGLGPSAQSFWWATRTASSRARRWANVHDLDRYAERLRQRYPPVDYRETLDGTALAEEYVLLALRTADGLDLNRLDRQYGVLLREQKEAVLCRLREEGLVHDDPDRVRLTLQGRLVADAITRTLLPE